MKIESGIINRYNGPLLFIQAVLIIGGFLGAVTMGYKFMVTPWIYVPWLIVLLLALFISVITHIIGWLMFLGYAEPDQSKGKKVWIITFKGRPTKVIVNSLTILLDWLPKAFRIVDKIEVDLTKVNHEYVSEKPIRCVDGYINSKIIAAFEPHGVDGLDLYEYVASGGKDGSITQLNGITTSWIQSVVNGGKLVRNGHVICRRITAEWLEKNSNVITNHVIERVTGQTGRDDENGENTALDDIKSLSIEITKFVMIFVAPDDVVKARGNELIQKAQRKALVQNDKTIRQLIKKRGELFGRTEAPNGTDQQAVLIDRIITLDPSAVKVVVNQGKGVNINEVK